MAVYIKLNNNKFNRAQIMRAVHQTKKTKQTPWPLVRERTIPTERSSLVDEI
jgi:hypothetical protein